MNNDNNDDGDKINFIFWGVQKTGNIICLCWCHRNTLHNNKN